jgi:hypothetical protein
MSDDNNNNSDTMAAQYAASASLRLPEFWPDMPNSWFVFAESKFRVRGITSESGMFDLVVGCLPHASLSQVLDVIEGPHATSPYSTLKQRLLSAHELTKFQRIEALFKMEALGGRKLSELLAQMLELCPRGEEKNPFFIFLFLQRLPRELRVLLGDEALEEPRDLADKADKLWALHSHQHRVVAAIEVEEEESPVAAVRQPTKRGRRGRGRGGAAQGGQAPVETNQAPAALARMSTGLCHFHWTYGEKAQKCETPCNWGN